MKTESAAMQTHRALTLTSFALCAKITRNDSVIFAYTDHDQDLIVGGVTYKAKPGFMRSALRGASDLSAANADVIGVIDDDSITEADLLAGLFLFADVEIVEVVWSDLTITPDKIFKGKIGDVPKGKTLFTAHLIGLADALQDSIGKVIQPTCRHDLGDSKCGFDLAAVLQNGAVTSVTSRRNFHASGLTGAGPRVVSYTANTISFVKPDKIKDSANGFVAAGFGVGDGISTTGTDRNDIEHTIKAIAAGQITTETPTVLKEAAGASVNIIATTPGYFDFGRVIWLTGANTGLSMEVKTWDGTDKLILGLQEPYDIQIGDTFSITPGCDKRIHTCLAFNRVLSFDGEWFVKGQDGVLTYPNAQ